MIDEWEYNTNEELESRRAEGSVSPTTDLELDQRMMRSSSHRWYVDDQGSDLLF